MHIIILKGQVTFLNFKSACSVPGTDHSKMYAFMMNCFQTKNAFICLYQRRPVYAGTALEEMVFRLYYQKEEQDPFFGKFPLTGFRQCRPLLY